MKYIHVLDKIPILGSLEFYGTCWCAARLQYHHHHHQNPIASGIETALSDFDSCLVLGPQIILLMLEILSNL